MFLKRRALVPKSTWLSVLGAMAEPVMPFWGERVMLPVLLPPIVRLWLLVVARLPLPVRKVLAPATEPAMEAVGVPEPTLMKANLAEGVALPPTKRSTVVFLGTM